MVPGQTQSFGKFLENDLLTACGQVFFGLVKEAVHSFPYFPGSLKATWVLNQAPAVQFLCTLDPVPETKTAKSLLSRWWNKRIHRGGSCQGFLTFTMKTLRM